MEEEELQPVARMWKTAESVFVEGGAIARHVDEERMHMIFEWEDCYDYLWFDENGFLSKQDTRRK